MNIYVGHKLEIKVINKLLLEPAGQFVKKGKADAETAGSLDFWASQDYSVDPVVGRRVGNWAGPVIQY